MTASAIKKSLCLFSALLLSNCHTNLYTAAKYNNIPMLQSEIRGGADLNRGAHPAHWFWAFPTGCVTISWDIAQLGLAIGTLGIYTLPWQGTENGPLLTPYLGDFLDTTPMQIAAERSNYQAMSELYIAGAAASNWQICQMAEDAITRGDSSLLRRLLGRDTGKAITTTYNAGSLSPIMQAVSSGREECARILLRAGASLDSTIEINDEKISCREAAQRSGRLVLYNKLKGNASESKSSAKPATKSNRETKSGKTHTPSSPAKKAKPSFITPDMQI